MRTTRNARNRKKTVSRGTGASPRLKAAVRALPRLLLRAGIAGSVVAAGVGGWAWLLRSETLAIREIAVEGTTPERGEEIRALLNLKVGDNLLLSDLRQARARAEGHPWVARVAARREFPDRLVIVVEERVPRLLLALDKLYYVDETGFPFKAVQPGDVYDLPVLTGLDREDWVRRNDTAREAIGGALALVDALGAEGAKDALAADEVSEIRWDANRGYSVVTTGGEETPFMTIRFGTGSYEEKLARLARVRAAEESASGGRDAVRTIDLTYASRVIVARE